MINHVRTLLLNESGAGRPSLDFYGEEYVPTGFAKLNITGDVATLWRELFGSNPDSAMLNYRLAQFMRVLHSTELESYVTGLDSRYTYDPRSEALLYYDYGIDVDQTSPLVSSFAASVIGELVPNEAVGRMRYVWLVETSSSNQVVIRELHSGVSHTDQLVFNSGVSNMVGLPGTTLQFRLTTAGPVVLPDNGGWLIVGMARPATDVGLLTAQVEDRANASLHALFGAPPVAPYSVFKEYWTHYFPVAHKLSAMLLTLAYRMEALRTAT